METQNQTHPSRLHLAALALGKLKPEGQSKLQEHVASCSTCSDFISKTPRDTLMALFRKGASPINPSDLSTPGIRDAGTISGLPSVAKAAGPATVKLPPPEQNPLIAGGPNERAPKQRLPDDEIPQELREQSKYRIIRLLGRGGMGSVYEAHHERMDRRVAIKSIIPSLVDHPEALKRFDQEVKAAARLDHTNVARAHDADEFGSLRVLVMEFVPGQSLDKFLAQKKQLSVTEACRLMRQAMVGLQHAHERGMVHRDLKPQNLMLTPDGKVKILDFGLAKIASERRAVVGLTRENALMGTPHYLAPEQALDAAKADIRADIYSLGCTLYCLLAGEPPFNGDTEMKVLVAHQNDAPRPLREVCPDVPRELSDLVDRMLAKNPADRPQTPKEVANALLPFAKGEFVAPIEQPANPLAFLAAEAAAPAQSAPRRPAPAPLAKRIKNLPGGVRLWSVGAAVLLMFFFGAWALGILSVRTPEGTIVLDKLPDNAKVTVDGRTVTLTVDGDELTITAVPKGEHKLELTRDGKTIGTDDVTIEFGGQKVRAKFEALAIAIGKEKPADRSIGEIPTLGKALPTERGKRIDLMPYVDVEKDAIEGKWTKVGREIRSDNSYLARLRIPYQPSEEYNFRVVFTRQEGQNDISQIIPLGDRNCALLMGAFDNSVGGFGLIGGKSVNDNPTSIRAKEFLRNGRSYESIVYVRKGRISASIDGKLVAEYPTTLNDLDIPLDFGVGDGILGVNSVGSPTLVHALEIEEVTRRGRRVDLPRIGDVPSLGKPAPNDKSLRTVDLLQYVDPSQDTVNGVWTRNGTELNSDGSRNARLRIPYQPPPEYDLHLSFTRREGRCEVAQILSHGVSKFLFALGTHGGVHGGFAMIHGKFFDINHTNLHSNSLLRNGRKYDVVIHVRNGWIGASVDGKLVAEYETKDFSDLTLPGDWEIGDGLLGVGSWGSPTAFHEIKIAEITGEGKPLSEPKAPVQSGGTAYERFPDAQIFAGTWKIWDGELVQAVRSRDVAALAFGDPDWKDYNIDVQIKPGNIDSGYVYVSFNGKSETDFRVFRLGTRTINSRGVWRLRGLKQEELTKDESPGNALAGDQWHAVRIEVRGSQCKCFVHGMLVCENTDESCSIGKVAVGTLWTDARFKDIKITSADDNTVLWQDLPKLPRDTTAQAAEQEPVPAPGSPAPAIAPFDAKQARAHQEAWAKYLQVPVEQKNAIGMRLVLIPPGQFMMGSSDEQIEASRKILEAIGNPNHTNWGNAQFPLEQPQHSVKLTQPYLLSATEVTFGQFRKFVDATKYVTEAERFGGGESDSKEETDPVKKKFTWLTPGFEAGDDSPATQVTWNDAAMMCNWLSVQEKLQPCYQQDSSGWTPVPGANGYRLPTEAEGEYACRAGTVTLYSFGDDAAQLADHAWYDKNGAYRAVALKPANAFGLHDMHGNVFELCQDWFEGGYYSRSRSFDPPGPPTGDTHVQRGGSFDAMRSRSAYRGGVKPWFRAGYLSFRVVRVAPTSVASSAGVAPSESNRSSAAFFNGKDLSGWQGLPKYWRVEGGAIVGAPASGIPAHTFLASNQRYKDFELSFQVRLKNDIGNSGVQVRSTLSDPASSKLTGPQIELFPGSTEYPTGSVVSEPKGKPAILGSAEVVARVWKKSDFNAMTIRCVGKHVTTTINGIIIVDEDFPSMPEEGFVGWQLHDKLSPEEVIFKDIRFVEMNARVPVSRDGGTEMPKVEPNQPEGVAPSKNEIDSVTAALAAAKQAHKRKVDELRNAVLQAFAKKDSMARGKGNTQALNKLRQERTAFTANGTPPTLVPIGDFERKLKTARTALAEDYKKAIEVYDKAKLADEAAAAKVELELIQGLLSRRGDLLTPEVKPDPPLSEDQVRQRIEAAWPGLGNRLSKDSAGDFALNLRDCGPQVSNLEPLKGLPLKTLNVTYNGELQDLSPLEGMNLKSLWIGRCPRIRDLRPLQGMDLDFLDLAQCNELDLTQLRGMRIKLLSIWNRGSNDQLRALQGVELNGLIASASPIDDLTPLMGMAITELVVDKCDQLSDLTPLKKMPLTKLNIKECGKIVDITPLKNLPLKEIVCDFNPDRDAKILRSIKTLETINGTPAAQFWKDAGNNP